jgi:hypothetical protein
MKPCRLSAVVLLLASALGVLGAPDLPRGLAASQRNLDSVLTHLRPALMSAGGAGRVYYSTVCAADDGTPLPFPRVEVRPASTGKTGLSAVREIFQNDKRVMVRQDPSGMVRITVGRPALELLQTRIRLLTLTPREQYNPGLAVIAVGKSKEVESAKRKLGLHEPLTVMDMIVVEPQKGLPHLPASMKEITVDQAFDLIAKTFGGVVLYAACADSSGARLVTFDYVGVVGVVDGKRKRDRISMARSPGRKFSKENRRASGGLIFTLHIWKGKRWTILSG